MSNAPTNSDDMIDSRDVIARIRELEDERDTFEPSDAEELAGQMLTWETEYPEDAEELKALKALESQAEGYSDWNHGAQLIRDSYFENYARDFAEEIGAMPVDASWPCICIDWSEAAKQLQMDYTSVSFDGVDYWVR